MAQQIQIRRDTSTNWTTANPTLAQGEMGLETNTGKLKIGNGTSAWNSLAYFGGAGALASLTDVSILSLASGNILIANASLIFENKSLSSLVNEYVSFSSLGSLAVMNQLSFTSLTNQPSLSSLAFQSTIDYTTAQLTNKPALGSLAIMNQLSFTSLLNQPSLGSLAYQNVINYSQVTLTPSLGSLAPMNQLSFTSLTNQPSLSSLAFQATIDYTTAQLTNKPALGSLAVMNQLSFTSLLNQPSLGSLAFVNSLTKSDVGLGNVTNDAQLKIASNLSDLNNVATARGNLSLGSLAVQNTATSVLASTASLNILHSNGIFNYSTISTNIIASGRAIFASQVSAYRINFSDNFFSPTGTINTLTTDTITNNVLINGRDGVFASTASIRTLNVQVVNGWNYGLIKNPIYGNGSDGALDFNGSYGYDLNNLCTYDPTTSTYTLTRDVYATSISVQGSQAVNTGGYRMFATISIENAGTIKNTGFNASGVSAGIGALGGFFRAGGNGSPGLPAGASGASGITSPLPTANSLIGFIGSRGASARNTIIAGTAGYIATTSLTILPNAIGGKESYQNIQTYMQSFIPANASTNVQPTYMLGGGGGAKSAVGTTATSGGGGGGGGVIFLSSPSITYGSLDVSGGNGGNATGTGGIFGGGGGGAGGIIAYVTPTNAPTASGSFIVTGGLGGTSAGTANTQSVSKTDNTYLSTATLSIFTMQPTLAPNPLTFLTLAIHTTYNAGAGVGINYVSGLGMSWVQTTQVDFGTIATPTRTLWLFIGYPSDYTYDFVENKNITVSFTGSVNTVRAMIDEIQNTSNSEYAQPYVGVALNSTDSATTLVTDLGYTPTTGNTQYSVLARAGGTAPVAGTGNTLLNSQTVAPLLTSEVAVSRASNSISWTTAGAAAMITIDLSQPTAQEKGMPGWDGKVIRFNA